MDPIQNLYINTTGPILNNLKIDLDEIDPYSRYSFREIQTEQFIKEAKFYICVVRENGKIFQFEASLFLQNCIHKHGVIDNPITRRPIEDFEIYVSSKESPDFQLYMKKDEVTTYPNHLPIIWDDLTFEKASRLHFMFLYGKHFDTNDLERATTIYKEAAKAGSTAAKIRLSQIYYENGNKELTVKYLSDCITAEDISTQNIFACARRLGSLQEHQLAFNGYILSAERGHQHGLGGVIRYLEHGVGVEKSLSKAAQWREKLPEDWRSADITDYFKYLKSINYSYDGN